MIQKVKCPFSPITGSIIHNLLKDILKITINGGGGMGGSSRVVYGVVRTNKGMGHFGFPVVWDVINQEEIEINSDYIGTAETVSLTQIIMTHNNTNFPSKKITMWVSHKSDVSIKMVSENDAPSMKECEGFSTVKLTSIFTDYHNELIKQS